ncbi:hypothetical protein [Eastern grey kangaroopox virus]|uniref:Uncharacterized protein n=1 Tax=Eastern grey kangaroopox virus TaxID=2042482 RepID=A0A2C9DSW9_9POXV|nr:hypothetical protein KM541_gp006 [Eastern grey kangaroopox virus]ATI21102.1 hypothetical protein [Eastern grey kangaroopox virus]ATX75006.1 hypothetical protein EKPV-NSW-ORF011 [Eastern grey kangaroopox virus]
MILFVCLVWCVALSAGPVMASPVSSSASGGSPSTSAASGGNRGSEEATGAHASESASNGSTGSSNEQPGHSHVAGTDVFLIRCNCHNSDEITQPRLPCPPSGSPPCRPPSPPRPPARPGKPGKMLPPLCPPPCPLPLPESSNPELCPLCPPPCSLPPRRPYFPQCSKSFLSPLLAPFNIPYKPRPRPRSRLQPSTCPSCGNTTHANGASGVQQQNPSTRLCTSRKETNTCFSGTVAQDGSEPCHPKCQNRCPQQKKASGPDSSSYCMPFKHDIGKHPGSSKVPSSSFCYCKSLQKHDVGSSRRCYCKSLQKHDVGSSRRCYCESLQNHDVGSSTVPSSSLCYCKSLQNHDVGSSTVPNSSLCYCESLQSDAGSRPGHSTPSSTSCYCESLNDVGSCPGHSTPSSTSCYCAPLCKPEVVTGRLLRDAPSSSCCCLPSLKPGNGKNSRIRRKASEENSAINNQELTFIKLLVLIVIGTFVDSSLLR